MFSSLSSEPFYMLFVCIKILWIVSSFCINTLIKIGVYTCYIWLLSDVGDYYFLLSNGNLKNILADQLLTSCEAGFESLYKLAAGLLVLDSKLQFPVLQNHIHSLRLHYYPLPGSSPWFLITLNFCILSSSCESLV